MHLIKGSGRERILGFTMVELLTVLSLMIFLMSLIGPLSVSTFEKAKAKKELLLLKDILKETGKMSYLTGKKYQLLLNKSSIHIKRLESQILTDIGKIDFENITFESQVILYDKYGHSDIANINVFFRHEELKLRLQDL
ncbi:type II secretion system protein [Flocculibacter collagenilyticus]|uniref:type II secretion system protein n=1 Tax=Flocculibacter collagenilyticus TaxID=2744479 RepID=UPI0018F325DF|nr:hypothetical protein [Flocculibacter collagenilyticus]